LQRYDFRKKLIFRSYIYGANRVVLYKRGAVIPNEKQAASLEVPLTALDAHYERFRLVRPREYSAMRDSVMRFGQISSVMVGRAVQGSERYEVIDGFKRYHALIELKHPKIKIRVLEGGTRAMKAALIDLNRSQGGLHAFEEALVVRSLYKDEFLDQQQIGVLLGRHKSWACRRLGLCERLCEEAIEHIRLGLIGFGTARELWRLPRGNQPAALTCVLEHRLNSRETAVLVSELLKSPRWEHACILRLPVDILEKRKEPKPAAFKGGGIWKRLSVALQTAHKEMAFLSNQAITLSAEERAVMVREIDKTATMFVPLKAELQKEI
jgi:ParB-like chromosome segregation protein Spo0J